MGRLAKGDRWLQLRPGLTPLSTIVWASLKLISQNETGTNHYIDYGYAHITSQVG